MSFRYELLSVFSITFWLLAFYGIAVWWFEYNNPKSKYKEFLELSVSPIGLIVMFTMFAFFSGAGKILLFNEPVILFLTSIILGLAIGGFYSLGRFDIEEEEVYEESFSDLDSWTGTLDCIGCGIFNVVVFIFYYPCVFYSQVISSWKEWRKSPPNPLTLSQRIDKILGL